MKIARTAGPGIVAATCLLAAGCVLDRGLERGDGALSEVVTSHACTPGQLSAFEREAGVECRSVEGRTVAVLTGALAEAQTQLAHVSVRGADGAQRVLGCGIEQRWDDANGDGQLGIDELDSLTNDRQQCAALDGSCLAPHPFGPQSVCVRVGNPFDLPECALTRDDVLAGRQCLLTSSSNLNPFVVVVGYEPSLLPPAIGDACDALGDDFSCRAFGGLCGFTSLDNVAAAGRCERAEDLAEPCEDESDAACRIVFGDSGPELRRLAGPVRRPTTVACAGPEDLTEFERLAGVTCDEVDGARLKVLSGALATAESQLVADGPGGPLGCGIEPRWDDANGNGVPDADELDSLTNARQMCFDAGGSCLTATPITGASVCVATADPFTLPECELTADDVLAGRQCLMTSSSNLNMFELTIGYAPTMLPAAIGDACDTFADEASCRAFDGRCAFTEIQPTFVGRCVPSALVGEPCEDDPTPDCRLVFEGGFEWHHIATTD